MFNKDFIKTFNVNWESIDIAINGHSSIDFTNYLSHISSKEDAVDFYIGYGFDITNPVQSSELYGNFQESMQFIKRYFLKTGNEESGLDLEIPSVFYTITDIAELLLIATGHSQFTSDDRDRAWASIILKVMHTILHADKDLRYRFFPIIQTQILDRFYKYLHRDGSNGLYIKDDASGFKIPIVDFETKSKKSRESTIIKLLHKKENVAEELFDRIGIRFVTNSKVDVLRLINFLIEKNVVLVNNVKPSRSQNSLFDLGKLKQEFVKSKRKIISLSESQDAVLEEYNNIVERCTVENSYRANNEHSSVSYRAIHFTCRQLIKYQNPFLPQFFDIKKMAKNEDSEIARKILDMDTSFLTKETRFFYPYEIQITDKESHGINSEGDASHNQYKKSQLESARDRLFKSLLQLGLD